MYKHKTQKHTRTYYRKTDFRFVHFWYISVFEICFSYYTANNTVFDLILFNVSRFISVNFLVTIWASAGVNCLNPLATSVESLWVLIMSFDCWKNWQMYSWKSLQREKTKCIYSKWSETEHHTSCARMPLWW